MAVDMILDCNGVFGRGYYASQAVPDISKMVDKKGRNVGGIVMSCKIILSLLKEDASPLPKVDRMLACWDTQPKADKKRNPKPEGYPEQLELFERCLTRMFGCSHAHPEFEADDAVATAAYKSESDGNTVYVVSGDKDLTQLVSSSVHYYSLHKKKVLSRKEIIESWGVKRPLQIALMLALIGDPCDGIKGVVRCGPAKAKKIFEVVEEDTPLDKAIGIIESQLKPVEVTQFRECLGLTLLSGTDANIPDPGPIVMEDGVPSKLGLSAIAGDYAQVRCLREGISIEEALGFEA